jgi:hypothetical protein
MLQLFCGYNIWYMQCCFQLYTFCTFKLVLCGEYLQCPIWLFSVVSWCHSFQSSCLGFYELFLDCSSFPYYYWLHFCFTLHMRCTFYCKVFVF